MSKYYPDITEITMKTSHKPLYGGEKKELGTKMFPFLARNYGLEFLYELASVSSIVGMKIPGLNSLFLNLILDFSSTNRRNYIKVKKIHNLMKFVTLDYFGYNFLAKIEAVYRPEKTKISSISELARKYKGPKLLKLKKVLVIGGSRGIGAYVTKLCSIMGARVTFTYNTQNIIAKNMKEEICKSGYKVKSIKLDVLNKNEIKKITNNYDQVYYFATPKIVANTSKKIDQKLLKDYKLFYKHVFEEVIKKFTATNSETRLFFPSTIFIDEENLKFREYWLAKKDSEKMCAQYIKKINSKIAILRLPPLDTDQNLSIIPTKKMRTSDSALRIINYTSNLN